MEELKKKNIVNFFDNIIEVGYCDLWYLLQGMNRNGYTCGVYGWNADIYYYNLSTAIVTGYRPFGNIQSNYKINNKYNEKARKIYESKKIKKWETKKRKINKLLDQYIKEIINNEEI